MNPYDWCIANKPVAGGEMTVIWHVGDLEIFHENEDTVGALISKVSEQYGKEVDMKIHQGKVQEYLGINIDYRE